MIIMKINKKILIPVVSAFVAVIIVFLSVGLTGSPDSPATEATAVPETLPVIATTAPEKDNTLKLSFIGDCVIGGDPINYREGSLIWYSENYPMSYFFEKVKGVLSEDDFTLSNMECVLSDNLELEAVDKGYTPAFWFRAKTKNAQILTEGSVEVAGVVNNHTYDYGNEGYADTVKALEDAGLLAGEDCSPVYFEKNGIKVGVVYANLWAYYQVNYITDALEEMQDKCDYKIVFFHGGEEGIHEPDNFKIDACRDLANSGLCDLIVGAHPHVLQPLEVVNGVPIMYSLGNFCFAGNNYPENKTVIFKATLTKNQDGTISAETSVVPCYVYTGSINNFQPAIIEDEEDKAEIMAMISATVDYQKETEPTTTAAPETEAQTRQTAYTELYIPEETETVTQTYIAEETEYYEEIETAISYY